MRPVGKWSVPEKAQVYGQVVSDRAEDSAYPGGADEETVSDYGGHLVAESISPGMREAIAALPDLINALEMVRDADEDCKTDGLPRVLPEHARAAIDAALEKAGVK